MATRRQTAHDNLRTYISEPADRFLGIHDLDFVDRSIDLDGEMQV